MYKYHKTAGFFFIIFAVQFLIAGSGIDEKMLTKMREEEKLSYDLYSEFYSRWNNDVFDNVRESEFVHMQRVKEILDKYYIEDPVEKNNFEKGKYSDKDVQKEYDEYTVKGCISDISALNTAALMEENDVAELRERISKQSDEYIIRVFTQMEKATQNHLKAFVKSLKSAGVEYKPQVLSQNSFDLIMNPQGDNGTAINR